MSPSRYISRGLCTLMLVPAFAACSGGASGRDSATTVSAASDSMRATTTASGDVATAENRDDLVERALDADSVLQSFGLDADDHDGRIVLKGVVRSAEQKDLATQVATREAAGIAIDNRIRVNSSVTGTARPVDVDDIEDQVEDAFKADSSLRSLGIDVDEENGRLVLDGTVPNAVLKASAEAIAKRVAGTVVVESRIRVK